MSVGLSVRPSAQNSSRTRRILIRFDIWVLFRNSVEKIQVSLNRTRIKGTKTNVCTIVLRKRKVLHKNCRGNQYTNCTFNIFFFEILTVYNTIWKNTVEPDRPQMTVWGMLIACWTPKATNTQAEYIMFIAFPLPL
jgi:hypothetical protein